MSLQQMYTFQRDPYRLFHYQVADLVSEDGNKVRPRRRLLH
jgi:hypothetical protein